MDSPKKKPSSGYETYFQRRLEEMLEDGELITSDKHVELMELEIKRLKDSNTLVPFSKVQDLVDKKLNEDKSYSIRKLVTNYNDYLREGGITNRMHADKLCEANVSSKIVHKFRLTDYDIASCIQKGKFNATMFWSMLRRKNETAV